MSKEKMNLIVLIVGIVLVVLFGAGVLSTLNHYHWNIFFRFREIINDSGLSILATGAGVLLIAYSFKSQK